MPQTAPQVNLIPDFEQNTQGPISETDWTGLYAITLLVVSTDIEEARKALPDERLELTPEYARDGQYPILMSCGSVLNARPRMGGSIGLNYLEVFSAIPGVRVRQDNGSYAGPFLYPRTGYLDHVIPVIFGRIAGYRKFWRRVASNRKSKSIQSDGFVVKPLFGGKPILSAAFEANSKFQPALESQRVKSLAKLMPPDMIGRDPFGRLIHTKFQFLNALGSAEDINDANAYVNTKDFIPGKSGPIHFHEFKAFSWDERYLPARLFVPWRLKAKDALQIESAAITKPVVKPKTRRMGAGGTQ